MLIMPIENVGLNLIHFNLPVSPVGPVAPVPPVIPVGPVAPWFPSAP